MRAAILAIVSLVLAASLFCAPARAGSKPQAQSSGATVVVKYPDSHCGISLAKENWLNSAKQRGAEVISEAYADGASAMKKLQALKASGACN